MPDMKLLSLKFNYFFFEGNFSPYAGAGLGYLWQQLEFDFDEGTAVNGSGGALILEAGLLLRRWPGYGTLAACAQVVLPFFSVTNPADQQQSVSLG